MSNIQSYPNNTTSDELGGLPCPHGRLPSNGEDGWKHCPHCLGLNSVARSASPLAQSTTSDKLDGILGELAMGAFAEGKRSPLHKGLSVEIKSAKSQLQAYIDKNYILKSQVKTEMNKIIGEDEEAWHFFKRNDRIGEQRGKNPMVLAQNKLRRQIRESLDKWGSK